ncbi:MAG: EamA family transporter [Aliidongia sp.]
MPRDGGGRPPARRGDVGAVIMALAVFGAWGLFPSFFKQLVSVPPIEILAHRILWSAVFMAGLLTAMGRLSSAAAILADRRTVGVLALSSLLIAANWLVYVSSVVSGHILEASLGYFISPLANVALGRLVLGERLTRPAGGSLRPRGSGRVGLRADDRSGGLALGCLGGDLRLLWPGAQDGAGRGDRRLRRRVLPAGACCGTLPGVSRRRRRKAVRSPAIGPAAVPAGRGTHRLAAAGLCQGGAAAEALDAGAC